MDIRLLNILGKNARTSIDDLSVMTGMSIDEVKKEIEEYEAAGIIRGYTSVVDWERLDGSVVSAIIELKVTPKAGLGFEEVAKRIMKYTEVESVYLMSGLYDLNVVVKGKTFQQVAMFVAKELSTIENVTSTATHFVLRRYKEHDVELFDDGVDDRGSFSL